MSSVPEVLRFESLLLEHGSKILLEIPAATSEKLRDMSRVEGTINGQPFRAKIEEGADGNFLLHVNAAMLRGAYARIGETVELAILGPEPDPVLPRDLRAEFDASPAAMASWNKLTKLGQYDWLRWIDDTEVAETRARRITRTIEQLAEGKRRACCVNVYAFMMRRIREDDQA